MPERLGERPRERESEAQSEREPSRESDEEWQTFVHSARRWPEMARHLRKPAISREGRNQDADTKLSSLLTKEQERTMKVPLKGEQKRRSRKSGKRRKEAKAETHRDSSAGI